MRLSQRDTKQLGDAKLLAACLIGDQSAWDELVQRYSRLVYSIALKSGLSVDDAADVVQNVFVTVLRRLESLREPDRFASWLITTTRRESWRYKKAQRDHILNDDIEIVDNGLDAEQQVIAWEEAMLTHRAMEELGDRCRTLLTMLFLAEEKPSYEDISSNLGIAIGSIGPTRARCLNQLRNHLSELGLVAGD